MDGCNFSDPYNAQKSLGMVHFDWKVIFKNLFSLYDCLTYYVYLTGWKFFFISIVLHQADMASRVFIN